MQKSAFQIVKSTFFIFISFVALWYYYFASSIVLRPFLTLVWGGLTFIGLTAAVLKNYTLTKTDVYFFGSMLILLGCSLFAVSPMKALSTAASFFLYYVVAKMIANNCSANAILNIILLFSIVHLVCLFIQVFAPTLYTATILKLIPASYHAEILKQMEWNESYHGFTVQTGMIALYMSVGAILSAVKISCSKKKVAKVLWAILLIVFLIATFFTTRRGPSIVTLLILALIYYKAKGSLLAKILVAAAIIFIITLIGIENIPGLRGIVEKFERLLATDSLWNGRDSNFAKAFAAFADRPIFGYGLGQVKAATGYAWLENAYLVILIESGLIGFVAFFFPYISTFVNTVKRSAKESLQNAAFSFSFYIQLLFILMSLIENYLGAPSTVFLLFVIVFAGERSYLDMQKKQPTIT